LLATDEITEPGTLTDATQKRLAEIDSTAKASIPSDRINASNDD